MINTNLFLDKYKPYTTRLCFFKINFEELINSYQKRCMELAQIWEQTVKITPLCEHINFLEKIDHLNPRSVGFPNKYLLSETQSDWCLYMDNRYSGTDITSQPPFLAGQWGVQLINLYLEPDYGKDQYGSVMFHWMDGAKPVSDYEFQHRTIMVHKEGNRVDFEQSGVPFTFENTANYEKRLKKDRLTVEMVEEYCGHFGIYLFDLDFYKGRSVIFSTE